MSEVIVRPKTAIGFLRVSSDKQGLKGDSPEDQTKRIEHLASKLDAKVTKYFEIWMSATNEELQPSEELLKYLEVHKGKIDFAFVAVMDRFTRAGYPVFEKLQRRIASYGTILLDAKGIIGGKTVNTLEHLGKAYKWSEVNPTRRAEIDEAEKGREEVTTILTRMIGAEIGYVRKGFHVRNSPMGFQNTKTFTEHGERVILTPNLKEADWHYQMFDLRAQNTLSDEEITERINATGYKTRLKYRRDRSKQRRVVGTFGGKQLTVRELKRKIQNPVYAGVSKDKMLQVDGSETQKAIITRSTAIVSIELFNKANRGKVVLVETGTKDEEGNEIIDIYKNKPPQWQLKKDKKNPKFPFKDYVLCPQCKRPLLGSDSTGQSKKGFGGYHCNRKHYFRVSVKDFNTQIETFVKQVRFSQAFKDRFQEIMLEEWHKRSLQATKDVLACEQNTSRLTEREEMLKATLVELLSQHADPTQVEVVTEQLKKVREEKTTLVVKRDVKQEEEINIETVIGHLNYYMEHFEDLVLTGSNQFQRAAIFGLIFEEHPTYTDLVNGTVRLSSLFSLNEDFKKNESINVGPEGLEPPTSSV